MCIIPQRAFSTARTVRSFDLPLKGVRVVDLSRVLAGPHCTQLLADLGADVIKVEESKRGDDTRYWAPPSAATKKTDPDHPEWDSLPEESAYFLATNRNKRSLGVNLKHEKGRAILHKLVKKADVLVENYLPQKLAKFGLSYEDCKALNAKLIYASITGYGQTGPYSARPGYDVMIAADAGLMHITGEPGGPPSKPGVALTDLTTGLYAYSAILAALLGRARTGKGTWIDISLFDCQIASLANIGSSFLIAGQEAKRMGTAHPSIVPYQTFPTKDGYILCAAGNNSQFALLSTALGHPEWASDENYLTNALRVKHRIALIARMTEVIGRKVTADWLAIFEGRGFAFAPINNIQQTFEHPQALHRGVAADVDHARAGPIKILANPVFFDGEKLPISRPPPVHSQHTSEILMEEGYTAEDIAQLKSEGAI